MRCVSALTTDDLNYSLIINTANGQARAAPVRLDSVTIGSIDPTRASRHGGRTRQT
jgi:predicted aspartyl protease